MYVRNCIEKYFWIQILYDIFTFIITTDLNKFNIFIEFLSGELSILQSIYTNTRIGQEITSIGLATSIDFHSIQIQLLSSIIVRTR